MGTVVAYPEPGFFEETNLTYTERGYVYRAMRVTKGPLIGQLYISRDRSLDEVINARGSMKHRGERFPMSRCSIRDPGGYLCRCDAFAAELRAAGHIVHT